MKRLKTICGLTFLFVSLCLAGCDEENNIFYFVNHSSYELTITPSRGQKWGWFILKPGDTYKVNQDLIVYFTYTPANNVWCDDWSQPGWIFFYDF